MATSCTSPIVELPPTCALTEQLVLTLQPPLTNMSVGPPSNLFEVTMMQVDMILLQAVEYPRTPSAFKPQGPLNTQAAAPVSQETDTPSPSSLNPATSSVMSLICGISESLLAQIQESSLVVNSHFSAFSQCLECLKQPNKPYSLSTKAALWQPPCSH